MLYAVFCAFLQIWRIKKRLCAALLPLEFSGAIRAGEAGETRSENIRSAAAMQCTGYRGRWVIGLGCRVRGVRHKMANG